MLSARGLPDGALVYRSGYQAGLMPDPELWVDEWSDEYMRIPAGNGSEAGPYRTARTPYAREVMRVLSPTHSARRIVAMVASQTMKTQVGLNWLSASMHMAPGNMLVLLPSLNLAKRVSGRISKTIGAVPVLRDRVAAPRSRDSRNTIDTKEFAGGTMYITTAGSAANLAEIPARYVYGDEVDRWEVSVDQEGDPVELAETRTSTFGRSAKIYYTSSPTIAGASRIEALFNSSDQRYYHVPCPHCEAMQSLEWENLQWSASYDDVAYACAECGALIDESAKTRMLAAGQWVARTEGDGETIGFTLSALYAPLGWVSWEALAKQYDKAKDAYGKGDPEPMQVFYNTRLALSWDDLSERTSADDLAARAEQYQLRQVPDDVVLITAAVDTQDNRLEVLILGWGEGLERWVIDHAVIAGDPADEGTWAQLDALLEAPLLRADGAQVPLRAVAVDSGGHFTQEVYAYTRTRRREMVFAVKGANRPGRPIVSQQPARVDVKLSGRVEKRGAELWTVGADTAKDWLQSRWSLAVGPGAVHFPQGLPENFFEQIVSERRLIRYVKGRAISEWVKGRSDRNEALDLFVYNLAALWRLGANRWRASDWTREKRRWVMPAAEPVVVAEPPRPSVVEVVSPAKNSLVEEGTPRARKSRLADRMAKLNRQ